MFFRAPGSIRRLTLQRMRTFLAIVLAVLSPVALSGDADDLLARLRTKYPSTRFDGVAPSPFQGIFEIRLGNNVAYTDAAGDVWLFGHLYDMPASRDLTAERLRGDGGQPLPTKALATARSGIPPSWPIAGAVVRVKGAGARKLYLVSDTECPFCRSLEEELAVLDNVTIYTFPVAFLSDGEKVRSAWCAEDRVAGWQALMRGEGKQAVASPCQTPVRSNTELALAAGVRGTPMMFRADGDRLSGFADAKRIDAWLDHSAL